MMNRILTPNPERSMIFILAEKAPVLFVCMIPPDMEILGRGNTLVIDPRMIGERFFNSVTISLHKTKEEIVQMITSVNPNAVIPDHLESMIQPHPGELQCAGCHSSNPADRLFENKCIVCWANEAKVK
jgi:hypothetical protein